MWDILGLTLNLVNVLTCLVIVAVAFHLFADTEFTGTVRKIKILCVVMSITALALAAMASQDSRLYAAFGFAKSFWEGSISLFVFMFAGLIIPAVIGGVTGFLIKDK